MDNALRNVEHGGMDLYFRGDESLLSGRLCGVIGSRKAGTDGLRRAGIVSRMLVNAGVTVVSGLAGGIDSVAHMAALRAGGRTVAVLGTPLDRYFPERNRGLQDRIGREHLLVSQFPEGQSVQRGNFVVRDRLLAQLCGAVVIIEAGDGSGTLHAGRECLRLGRPLWILRNQADRRDVVWPVEFVRGGARILDRENLGELLDSIA